MKLRFPTRTESLSEQLASAFETTLARTDQVFELMTEDAYWMRPIPLRHPVNFYEGHLPAFIWNTVFRRTLNLPSFNPEFDRLFERGIDPQDQKEAAKLAITSWPSRKEVQAYKEKVHESLFELITDEKRLKNSQHPLMKNGAILWLVLEHEMMHQETLLYMLHQLPNQYKTCPPHYHRLFEQNGKFLTPQPRKVKIPAGVAHLGADETEFDFTWDNECPSQTLEVDAFSIDAFNITNGNFLEFVNARGYQNPSFWTLETWKWRTEQNRTHPFFWKIGPNNIWLLRDFFEEIPLPLTHPVFVTHAEAQAFARWRGESLPTEAEWHRAAFGDGKARYPWGNATPTAEHGNFNFKYGSTVPAGQFPKGASRFGVHDLIGNGWEWTETTFAPFSGFTASEGYPQYSVDFFDGQHYIVKGGSCFTDTRLLRRSFRNWFYWHYPYAYATFRCVIRNQ
jgi:ergothioneine biosynthesis protein EgtB